MTKLHLTESFMDSLQQAVEDVHDFTTERETDAWIQANADELMDEIESRLPEIVSYLKQRPEPVTKPVLSLNGGKIELYVYDAYQSCPIAEHRSFQFGSMDGTAGLVYVDRSYGLNASENHINNASTWAWIQEWMQKGMDAAKLAEQPSPAA